MHILCLFGRHDWKTYHRWFRNPKSGEAMMPLHFIGTDSNGLPITAIEPKTIRRLVHKCKRCGKRINEY